MMRLHFRFRALQTAVVATFGLAAALGSAHAQQPLTMKFATLTINDMQTEFIKLYKEELEKAAGGRIKVEGYPGG